MAMWQDEMDKHYRKLRLRAFFTGAFYATACLLFFVWFIVETTGGPAGACP
jgi:hypothetical protein